MKKQNTAKNRSKEEPKRQPYFTNTVKIHLLPRMGIRRYLFLVILIAFVVSMIVAEGIVLLLDYLLDWTLTDVLPVFIAVGTTIVASVTVVFLSRRVSAPILRLADAMKKVSYGDFTTTAVTKSKVVELEECYGSFNTMTAELRANEMLQSDFVSNVSHEFKTPLNAISGYATLLSDGEGMTEDQKEYVRRIIENTGRLTELVGNILLLSKLEHSAIPMPSTHFSMDETVRRAIVTLQQKWEAKNLELDIDLEEINFFGPEGLLSHVFTNLCDNAIKFNRPGGLLEVRLFRTFDTICFSVRDSGIGMTDAQKTHIFDRFFQADSTHSGEGNGLGLSLVKRICDVQGGRIEVESELDKGSKFTVFLPTI